MPARSLLRAVLQVTGAFRPEVVVFDLTHRCNSACRGCAFRDPQPGELPASRWGELAREAAALGFQEALLTGGEPLSHPDIATILPAVAARLPVSLMTNGLALLKHAPLVRAHAARVFVSFDAATPATYRLLRGVDGLDALVAGARALAGHALHARVTVWAENVVELPAIVELATTAGFTELSFLAADTTSDGFGNRGDTRGTSPRPEQALELAATLTALRRLPLVKTSDYAIDRVVRLARGQREAPRCLAPWTSGVVDPSGAWRHCFFLPTRAATGAGLRAAIDSTRAERRALDLPGNPTCRACVCWRG